MSLFLRFSHQNPLRINFFTSYVPHSLPIFFFKLITGIIHVEEHKFWFASLSRPIRFCPSLLTRCLPSTPFLNARSLCASCKRPYLHPYKTRGKIVFHCFVFIVFVQQMCICTSMLNVVKFHKVHAKYIKIVVLCVFLYKMAIVLCVCTKWRSSAFAERQVEHH